MKIPGIMIILLLLAAGSINCFAQDSTAAPDCGNNIPGWLQERIKEMTLDERHYAGTRVFAYEIDSTCVYRIQNPFSSIYYDLYYSDGKRLNTEAVKKFIKEKDEPLLIWENHPAVRFDSLKKNIEKPEDF